LREKYEYNHLAVEDFIFPALTLVIAIVLPLVFFGLKKGQAQTVTTTNVYNLKSDVTNLEKKQAESCADAKRRFDKIYETLNEIGGDIKLHTNQLANMQVDLSKIEDRLREAEGDIIRVTRDTDTDRDRNRNRE
jgi:septal ring factor EnvC (AmiA/AmiB activator)